MECDVIHRDGRIWRSRRHQPTEVYSRRVIAWSAYGPPADGAFVLTMRDGSNHVTAVFRRRVPPHRPRKYIRQMIDSYSPIVEGLE